ncbi:MAG: hypothetical protein ACRBBN_08785 [Methyloligellaceae bacterium]
MAVLQILAKIFLFPGEFVRRYTGITVEQDGGILRSFVNMVVWGVMISFVAFRLFL